MMVKRAVAAAADGETDFKISQRYLGQIANNSQQLSTIRFKKKNEKNPVMF
jgi:hypothetical protein